MGGNPHESDVARRALCTWAPVRESAGRKELRRPDRVELERHLDGGTRPLDEHANRPPAVEAKVAAGAHVGAIRGADQRQRARPHPGVIERREQQLNLAVAQRRARVRVGDLSHEAVGSRLVGQRGKVHVHGVADVGAAGRQSDEPARAPRHGRGQRAEERGDGDAPPRPATARPSRFAAAARGPPLAPGGRRADVVQASPPIIAINPSLATMARP